MILPREVREKLASHLTESKRLSRALTQLLDREELAAKALYARSLEANRFAEARTAEALRDNAVVKLDRLRGLITAIDDGHDGVEAELSVGRSGPARNMASIAAGRRAAQAAPASVSSVRNG